MKPTNMPKQQSWIHFYLFFVGNALEGGVVTQLHILHDGVVQRASRSRRESREKSLYSSIFARNAANTPKHLGFLLQPQLVNPMIYASVKQEANLKHPWIFSRKQPKMLCSVCSQMSLDGMGLKKNFLTLLAKREKTCYVQHLRLVGCEVVLFHKFSVNFSPTQFGSKIPLSRSMKFGGGFK